MSFILVKLSFCWETNKTHNLDTQLRYAKPSNMIYSGKDTRFSFHLEEKEKVISLKCSLNVPLFSGSQLSITQ